MNSDALAPAVRRIKRFGSLQAGKVLGVMYAGMGLLVAPIFLATALFELAPSGIPTLVGVALALFTPIFYGAIGFVGGVISAWLYNVTARFTGGMEVEVEAV
jgi:hypothetical protein